MQLERYELKAEQSLKVFEFTSEGPKGRISKIVQFGETNLKGLYNLVFRDKDPITGEILPLSLLFIRSLINIRGYGSTQRAAPKQERGYIAWD